MFPRFSLRRATAALFTCAVLLCAPQIAHADDVSDAKQVVQSVMREALENFAGKTMPNDQRLTVLHGFIDRYGDVTLSSQDILGRYWAKATPEQQAEFKKVVVDYTLGSWAQQLADYPADQRIDFTESQTLPNGRILLHSLASHSGDVSPVDWTLARVPDGHIVIVDAAVEGVSMIQTMKGDFLSIIRANNGDFDALLTALKQKVASYQK